MEKRRKVKNDTAKYRNFQRQIRQEIRRAKNPTGRLHNSDGTIIIDKAVKMDTGKNHLTELFDDTRTEQSREPCNPEGMTIIVEENTKAITQLKDHKSLTQTTCTLSSSNYLILSG